MNFKHALFDAFLKFSPFHQVRNPVIFTVYVCAFLITGIYCQSILNAEKLSVTFSFFVMIFLWLTVYFANFAESAAESRGKAQANALRKSRLNILAKKLTKASRTSKYESVTSSELRSGDLVLVEAGDFIPVDGVVVEGIASVNESAITGESAPVIRENTEERRSVTGGTQVISDWLIVKITTNPGESFLDHMISLVEGAKRQKTPNEIALSILLAALTLIFLLVCSTLVIFSIYSVSSVGSGSVISITTLSALFVCLAPTTIGSLLSAIGIAGMDRMIQMHVVAVSGHAVEAAGDVDVLILDKTGTITLGNRQATDFIPLNGVSMEELADAAQLASLTDETPEGRSIVVLAKQKYGLRGRDINGLQASFIPFTAQTRVSGINFQNRQIRKGAYDAIEVLIKELGGTYPDELSLQISAIARQGETPLVVSDGSRVLGIIRLKDIIKGGIRERFAKLRQMGIKTIMVTGDNPLTAAAIAAEAGVDDFLANAKPEDKLYLIKKLQEEGHLVAMTGDGTNDAPALAQADVAVAMNTGTQAAKEAGNMVDLESNPTKLVEIVEIGKQLLMTRGALTTFSIANDIAKYFAILPAAFIYTYPQFKMLDIMHLSTPESAILSAVIFNAFIIILLVPLALKGVKYRSLPPSNLLRINVTIYGLGGLVIPFIGIKVIDMLLSVLGIAQVN